MIIAVDSRFTNPVSSRPRVPRLAIQIRGDERRSVDMARGRLSNFSVPEMSAAAAIRYSSVSLLRILKEDDMELGFRIGR